MGAQWGLNILLVWGLLQVGGKCHKYSYSEKQGVGVKYRLLYENTTLYAAHKIHPQ